MRAKFINEIKQNIKKSGLAGIEIGRAGMNDGYKKAAMLSPNIKSKPEIDNPSITWASLKFLKNLIPTLLNSSPNDIIMVGSREISDEAERYLHSVVFTRSSDLEKNETSFIWKDTGQEVKAVIHTNDIKGVSIVEYTTPEDRFVVYYFFRKR